MSDTFTFTVDTANAAFTDPAELPRILRGVADLVAEGCQSGSVRDSNGNTVGRWTR